VKGLTSIEGIRVGHATDLDGITGCTVVLCEGGAVGGVDVRGSASGTQEIGVLDPMHVTSKVHAVVLSGGSAFGLEAACGVRRYLEGRGVGFEVRGSRVPIVPSAILFDLAIGKAGVRPTRESGEAAAAAASTEAVEEGCVGAGTGATIGKIEGLSCAMKGGIGSSEVELGGRWKGIRVAALVAVNAFGDVLDPRGGGRILAGARKGLYSKEFRDTNAQLKSPQPVAPVAGNTTLAVVATNAKLTKVEATKLAQLAHLGMARSITPLHTTIDGDCVFSLSVGERSADINALGVAAAEALADAIVRAIQAARGLGGVPALRDLGKAPYTK
jgi:L-aminopeptidase/D-esterase-like protein